MTRQLRNTLRTLQRRRKRNKLRPTIAWALSFYLEVTYGKEKNN